MAQRDYYEILGVERTIDAPGLKSAYRKLAMIHHPDRNGGSEESLAQFKEISEAYTVLSDDQKRAAYDRFGHAGVNGGAGGGDPFGRGGGQGFHDINDIFSQVFGDAFGDALGVQRGLLGGEGVADLGWQLRGGLGCVGLHCLHVLGDGGCVGRHVSAFRVFGNDR